MTVGIEVVGLALGIFPIVVETVEWYSSRVSGRDIKHLTGSLQNQSQIFHDSVQLLLQSVVPPAELQVLLGDFEGDGWRNQALSDTVTARLGRDAGSTLAAINEIYKTIARLVEKLPKRDQSRLDENRLDRLKKVVKGFVYGPYYKSSLARLKENVDEFRKLVKGAVKLAPPKGGPPKGLRNLGVVQECANGLYDAFQANWKCNCDQLHPANIRLDQWSLQAEKDTAAGGDHVDLQFSFLCAEHAQHARSDHWMTAQISPLTPLGGARPVTLGSLRDVSPRPIATQSGAPLAPLATSPTSLSSAAAPLPPSPTGSPGGANATGDDLCTITRTSTGDQQPRVRRRLGSISDTNGHSYDLFSEPGQSPTMPTTNSYMLADCLGKKSILSNKIKVQLGLMLAWAVLQISSTDWLRGSWTKDNILLVMDSPNKPLPYVSHRFESSKRGLRSSTLSPTSSNIAESWIKSPSLFALGVFLLELCYKQSIEDLAAPDEKPGGHATMFTSYLTAMRLAKSTHVQDKLGCNYAKAVQSCLYATDIELDQQGLPKDSSQFAQSVWKNIISPLNIVSELFGH